MVSSSSSFFKKTLFGSLSAFFALQCLARGADGPFIPVKVPIEVFHRRPIMPPPLSANLWIAENQPSETRGRAVMLLHMSHDLAKSLRSAGLHVLELDLRGSGQMGPKMIVEDIQSGVVFLKTDPRIQAQHVSIVGSGIAAHGAAEYAGANKQVGYVIDALALVAPASHNRKISLADAMTSMSSLIPVLLVNPKENESTKACKAHCKVMRLKSARGPALNRALLGFLL